MPQEITVDGSVRVTVRIMPGEGAHSCGPGHGNLEVPGRGFTGDGKVVVG